jgi:hypothetical protein
LFCGGESVSQLTLKDNAFSTFIDQDPPFELRPGNAHERTILVEEGLTPSPLRTERSRTSDGTARCRAPRPEDGLLTQSKRLVRLPSTRSTIARAVHSYGPEYGAYLEIVHRSPGVAPTMMLPAPIVLSVAQLPGMRWSKSPAVPNKRLSDAAANCRAL